MLFYNIGQFFNKLGTVLVLRCVAWITGHTNAYKCVTTTSAADGWIRYNVRNYTKGNAKNVIT